MVLEGTAEEFPRLEHLWVDQGYTGVGKEWIEEHLGWSVEVVRHPPKPRGEWRRPIGDLDDLSLPSIFRMGSTCGSTPGNRGRRVS